MELKFESFGLPYDGLTRVEEIEGYRGDALVREGWSMVGMANATCGTETKLFGVYRMTSDTAVGKALEAQRSAEKRASESETKVRDLEYKIKNLMEIMASKSAGQSESQDQPGPIF